MPLVSVLTTACNREKYLAQSIESVLASSLADFELTIVDDASSDTTVAIAREYEKLDRRVRVYLNEKNIGDYPYRNRAASYATGKYIKYLDSDDVLYPYGLQVMVDAMERFPEAGFGLASKPEAGRMYPVCIRPEEIFNEHFNGFHHFNRAPGSAIIRRDVFEKVGGFPEERLVGDMRLWLKLAVRFSMVKFPFDLYWNRIHPGQEVRTPEAPKIYATRTKEILLSGLYHPDCPLTAEQVTQFTKQMRRRENNQKLLKWLKKVRSST